MNDVTDLVERGMTAARVGDIEEARRLLRRATREEPNNAAAWLGLAGVVETLSEKAICFEHVLEIEPDNREAQAGLAAVNERLAEKESSDAAVVACYRHPETETSLRCNRCNRPICPKCARRTPVGFRCPDCIREQEDKYYSGTNRDYWVAVAIAFPLSFIIAALFYFILGNFGIFSWIIAFFASPAAAGFIAEAVRWAVSKRRSRYLAHTVVACLVIATLPFVLLPLFLTSNFYVVITPAIFMFLGTTTVFTRLR